MSADVRLRRKYCLAGLECFPVFSVAYALYDAVPVSESMKRSPQHSAKPRDRYRVLTPQTFRTEEDSGRGCRLSLLSVPPLFDSYFLPPFELRERACLGPDIEPLAEVDRLYERSNEIKVPHFDHLPNFRRVPVGRNGDLADRRAVGG